MIRWFTLVYLFVRDRVERQFQQQIINSRNSTCIFRYASTMILKSTSELFYKNSKFNLFSESKIGHFKVYKNGFIKRSPARGTRKRVNAIMRFRCHLLSSLGAIALWAGLTGQIVHFINLSHFTKQSRIFAKIVWSYHSIKLNCKWF